MNHQAQATKGAGLHTGPGPHDAGRVTVLVIDDHPCYTHGARAVLSEAGYDVGAVAGSDSVRDAFALVDRDIPDVVLLNERIGVEAVAALRRRQPDLKILMVAASCQPNDVRRAMRAGANGFVLKTSGIEELLYAVKIVAAGGTVHSSGIQLAWNEIDRVDDDLNEDEMHLLKLMSVGLTNGEIAKDMNVSRAVVKRRVHALFEKLEVATRLEAALYASRRGLV